MVLSQQAYKNFFKNITANTISEENKNCFTLPKPTSNFLLKSIRYNAAKLWTDLPSDVRVKESLATFKEGLKKVQI